MKRWVAFFIFTLAAMSPLSRPLGAHPVEPSPESSAPQPVATSASVAYDVGPGMPYATIGAVPWGTLGPGDTVRIHWRAGPYREMILLSTRGEEAQPIRILGVPGPDGARPIIDAQNAVISPQLKYAFPGSATRLGTPNRGVVAIAPAQGYEWGFKPGYIEIAGLDIRNAHQSNTFTDADGNARTYMPNAASIFVERGEHIAVRNCVLTGSGNGFFVASGDSEQVQSRDILVEGNHIYGNGNVDSYLEHNVYTEAIGIVFQYNYLGLPRAGSLGNNLKDRSAGTVIRYNWIEAGGHMLDLVNPQDSAPQATKDPAFHQTFVYGNVFINGPGDQGTTLMIQYGGDDGEFANYRKGALYFYNNTVVIRCNQTGPEGRWRTVVLQVSTNDETVDARNNIIYRAAATPGADPTELTLLADAGTGVFGVNWISPNWVPSVTSTQFTGTITGTENFLSSADNNPGFVELASYDVRLARGSSNIDRGWAPAPAAQGAYDVTREYVVHQSSRPRPVVGTAIDLGAFEFTAGP